MSPVSLDEERTLEGVVGEGTGVRRNGERERLEAAKDRERYRRSFAGAYMLTRKAKGGGVWSQGALVKEDGDSARTRRRRCNIQ